MRVSKETSAVLVRSDAEALHKGAAKAVGIVKANLVGDTLHGATCGRQSFAGFVKPQALHEGSRTAFELCREASRELPWTKIDALRQHLNGQVPIEVSEHPRRQISETAGGGDLELQRLGKLLLSAGPFHIHHQGLRPGSISPWR